MAHHLLGLRRSSIVQRHLDPDSAAIGFASDELDLVPVSTDPSDIVAEQRGRLVQIDDQNI